MSAEKKLAMVFGGATALGFIATTTDIFLGPHILAQTMVLPHPEISVDIMAGALKDQWIRNTAVNSTIFGSVCGGLYYAGYCLKNLLR